MLECTLKKNLSQSAAYQNRSVPWDDYRYNIDTIQKAYYLINMLQCINKNKW